MSFASPLFLLSLLALPAAVGLQHLMRSRQRRHAIRFTGVPTLAGVVPNTNRIRRHIPPIAGDARRGQLARKNAHIGQDRGRAGGDDQVGAHGSPPTPSGNRAAGPRPIVAAVAV